MSTDKQDPTAKLDMTLDLVRDPVLAHHVLFQHRHPNETPGFHKELIKLYHSAHPRVLALCFRGSGKSTVAEEAITLLAASGKVHNILIIGDSWLRACDRLRAIKRELETNEWLIDLFGDQTGETWQESRIVLQNGTAITAHGAGQALRGAKHLSYRPDLCFVDDLESIEAVATPDARRKLSDWFYSDLVPALDPDYRMIVAATPLHPQALAVLLQQSPAWRTVTVPIEHIDEAGNRQPSWPDRFSLAKIDDEMQLYTRAGKQHRWAQEYMVQAVDPAVLTFKPEHMRYEPMSRSWEPVFVSIDPARTIKDTSSTTGIVVASFVGRRLVIWEARAERFTPRDIIEDIFKLEGRYHPVVIGVEKDGLEEFLMQPIREEELKRGVLLPIRPLKAPKGKDEFITRLQPFFAAGDVVFAGTEEQFGPAVSQFLSFPTGYKDVPNAAAYLFELRQGTPVYVDASGQHLNPCMMMRPAPFTLAINAGPYGVAAVLFQYHNKVLYVHKDWVSERPAGEIMSTIVEEAKLYTAKEVTVIAPPAHFDTRNMYGLLAACRGVSALRKGGDPLGGRELIRELLRSEAGGMPRVSIGEEAVWTRRALYGGFRWDAGKVKPKESLPEHLMVGLESAIAPAAYVAAQPQRVMTTPDGRNYNSAEVRW